MADESIDKSNPIDTDGAKDGKNSNAQADNEKTMPFMDHLEDLRRCLIKCLVTVVVFSIGSYVFSKHVMSFLTAPYPQKLIFLSPAEGFMIQIKISFFAGLIVSLPFLFGFLWQFIAPGLYKRERTVTKVFILLTTLCFLTGAAFAYYLIIPVGLKFLLGFQTDSLVATITIEKYLSFVTVMILSFGIVFEMPILAYLLSYLELLTPQFMRKYRPHAIVLIFIVAAVITPTVDPFTQIMLGVPLTILYEISIIISGMVLRKKQKK